MRPQDFKKGVSGNPGGRPKGARSKVRHDVGQTLKDQGCNPFIILAQIALGNVEYNNGRDITARLRMESSSELAQYIAPKLKSIEITGDEANKISLNLNYGSPKKEDDVSGA